MLLYGGTTEVPVLDSFHDRSQDRPILYYTYACLHASLLSLSSPRNTLSNLQAFYDTCTVEGHVRSQTSLGKRVETYCNLLVTKLPSKMWKNIAQLHGSGEWTLEVLQQSITQEIRILELEIQTNQTHSHPTASFHTEASKISYKP